jgi:hypothetical protein
MLPVYGNRPTRKERRTARVTFIPSANENVGKAKARGSQPASVTVHASRALQQEVHRSKIADEEVEVQVERLLEYLGAHHDVTLGSLA